MLGVFVLFLGATVLAPRLARAETPIALEEAVRLAVERNLELRAQAFNPALAGTDVRRAWAVYNPTASALLDHQQERSPLDPGSSLANRRRTSNANVSVQQLLPSGATLSGSFTNLFTSNSLSGTGSSFSRYDQPELSVSLSQPLLQGFGREVTERDILTAKDAREAALAGWQSVALAVIANVRGQYFALVQARDNLDTLRASLEVARRVHAENQARVREGVLPAANLLDSELGVDQRELALLEGERAVKDLSDQLRLLLQLPGEDVLAPQETVTPEGGLYDERREIEIAHAKRPDLLQARIVLRSQERQLRISDNLALPSVDLTGGGGLAGLGASYGDAVGDVSKGTFPFWSVGLVFRYPIGNDAAEANATASRLRVRQAKVQIRSLETNAALSVRSALRNVASRRRQIEVGEKGVLDADVRLASYLKRQKLGLATTKDVLQVEADLTAARVILASARSDYQGAFTQLWLNTGELLERHGIRVPDPEVESMAWKDLP